MLFARLCLAMALVAATAPVATLAQPREALVSAPSRTRTNFNADWRFAMADVPAAREPGFNDAAWSAVGLPHSFGIPYFQSPKFPVGFGWYRKRFDAPGAWRGRRVSLEFEGAFQDAEVFVNGQAVGRHLGGYTGFSIDITDAVVTGRNVVSVRVNNLWNARLAPRAGEHVFQGGIYRDVWLVTTDPVHVPWYGTRVTTPDLSAEHGRVAIETEVRNASTRAAVLAVRTEILDAAGRSVARLSGPPTAVSAGGDAKVRQVSAMIDHPALWSPERPALYKAVTTVSQAGRVVDRYETSFGFRWFEWTADRGFFLNGEHRYLKGANVHQDQAGWGDAVTNTAIERDVQIIKDAGMDFIRGSHYPHDPHFAEATDKIGMLFWSEAPFWGIGGFGADGNWLSSAYPVDPADKPQFEDSVKQQLTEMIRITRNHPSVVAWSMGNETFFSKKEVLPDVRRFLGELVVLTHQLDPTRPAAIGGVQRGDIDKIGDVAGYNGDGAVLYPNPGVPSLVSEYGSTKADRPGAYEPGWGDLPKTPQGVGGTYPWRTPWRAGEAIWAGFDHGSVVGRSFGSMGIVDYSRLPKRSYFWYRNAYRGVPPPAWPVAGQAASLLLTADRDRIERADGTDDVQLVVTVLDAQGRELSNSPPVTLEIEAGPGELPTGRHIRFAPDSDIPIRDGKAAIAMRSWQAGVSRLRASSPGLQDAVLTVRTVSGPAFTPGVTPLVADRPYVETQGQATAPQPARQFGLNNPTAASSSSVGHSSKLANDGDATTYWAPTEDDAAPWLLINLEKIVHCQGLELEFPQAGAYRFLAQIDDGQGGWRDLVDQSTTTDTAQRRVFATKPLVGGQVRIKLMTPAGALAGIAEVRVTGTM